MAVILIYLAWVWRPCCTIKLLLTSTEQNGLRELYFTAATVNQPEGGYRATAKAIRCRPPTTSPFRLLDHRGPQPARSGIGPSGWHMITDLIIFFKIHKTNVYHIVP